jgi:hypothetical protein
MKKVILLASLILSLSACTTTFNKGDVCRMEGGERNLHSVCVHS